MNQYEAVLNSARWAAYGDAIGFITELTDLGGLKRRTNGVSQVTETIPWKRRIGGQFGVEVELPAGAYSDDTQLRLASSRAIRGDGRFDVEAFAKVELPVWSSYALGAGRASKLAASSLAKHVNTWSSNFYSSKDVSYVRSGGNGASIRIQPHVWAWDRKNGISSLLRDVVRNTVTTHGHPRAILGAAFHALLLTKTLEDLRLPRPDEAFSILEILSQFVPIIRQDRALQDFWILKWEAEAGLSLEAAFAEVITELRALMSVRVADERDVDAYHVLADKLGCTDPAQKGSATKTVVAAYFLANLFEGRPNEAMIAGANILETDTDSICSMAGALFGPTTEEKPKGVIQDLAYIEAEAARMFAISTHNPAETFPYPDLLHWEPPTSQADSVGTGEKGRVALAGLSYVKAEGPRYDKGNSKNGLWQWFKLEIGQEVLAKVRPELKKLPLSSYPAKTRQSREENPSLFSAEQRPKLLAARPDRVVSYERIQAPRAAAERVSSPVPRRPNIDALTSRVIEGGFQAGEIGTWLLRLSEEENGIELVIAFASIVAKARRARTERNRRQPETTPRGE